MSPCANVHMNAKMVHLETLRYPGAQTLSITYITSLLVELIPYSCVQPWLDTHLFELTPYKT